MFFLTDEKFIKPHSKNNILTAHKTPAIPRRREISSDAIGWLTLKLIAFNAWLIAQLP